MEIPIKAILLLAWEPPKIYASQWFYPHLVSSTPVLLTDRSFVYIYNWKQEEAALVASHITENWNLATPTKPPSPTALEVVILTTPSADNLIKAATYLFQWLSFSILHNT